jgi:hypothetical protein
MSSKTAELERRIEALVGTIEQERAERKAEADAASSRIAELEARLAARGTVGNSAATARRAASPGQSSPAAKAPGSPPSARKTTTASSDRAASQSAKSTASTKFSRNSEASSSSAKKTPEPAAKVEDTTAAQHSWDKLCALVKDDFTVKELWLVSLETLRQLLVHYGLNDPIECAQIECQWALLQEGKDKVERATPKKAPSPRSAPFVPAKQSGDFDLRNGPGAPSMSRRTPLSGDSVRPCNPNASTERARSVSPGSKGAVRVDPIQGSNPNDSVSPLRSHLGKRTWDAPPSTIYRDNSRPFGKDRSHSPRPEVLTAYPQRVAANAKEGGVKRFAEQLSPDAKSRGLKTGYKPPAPAARPESLRTSQVASGGGAVHWQVSHGH